jgi:hypothetical protein
MAATKISDVIVPDVFNPYVVERTAEKSALYQSGIIQSDAQLNALAQSGGTLLQMPFWADLTGDDEVLSDTGSLTAGAITASKDIARLHMRGRAWGVNDLAKALSGDDPMGVVGDLVADYWARRMQAALIKTLDGVFASATMAGNLHDITAVTGADTFTGEHFIDATHKLGDAENLLTAIMVHSATYASMRKQNLINFIPNSQGVYDIPTYMGKRVIVDDGLPIVSTTNYTTYLFGAGAIGYGEGAPPVPTETDRDSLAGEDYLITRKHFLLHPRGVKWNEASVAGDSPTNAELATAANWTRVYENKNIRIVKFLHKL